MKATKSYQSVIWALSVITFGLPLSASAGAPSQFEDFKFSVTYADLDIESEAGARVLYTRLKRAAETACDVRSWREVGSLRRVSQTKQCYDAALNTAVERIDSDELTRIHAS